MDDVIPAGACYVGSMWRNGNQNGFDFIRLHDGDYLGVNFDAVSVMLDRENGREER